MAASTSRAMSSIQCATTPSLHALHNTPMKLLFVRVALAHSGSWAAPVHRPRLLFATAHEDGGIDGTEHQRYQASRSLMAFHVRPGRAAAEAGPLPPVRRS